MNRRGFLKGILAAATAPYVVTTAGVPVRTIQVLSLEDQILAAYRLHLADVLNATMFPPLVVDGLDVRPLTVALSLPERQWFTLSAA